jgi:hypothetical protein
MALLRWLPDYNAGGENVMLWFEGAAGSPNPEAKIIVGSHAWRLLTTPLARLVAGEGKRRGCCGFFRNSRDARVRVQETVAIHNCQAFLMISPDFCFRFGAKGRSPSDGEQTEQVAYQELEDGRVFFGRAW